MGSPRSRHFPARVVAACAFYGLLALAGRAHAEWDFGATLRRLEARERGVPSAFKAGRSKLALIVEETEGRARPASAVPINSRFYALYAGEAEARTLFAGQRAPRAYWSAPRRLLLDRADGWLRASSMRARANVTGRGVVVGIIDTGVDVTHPDLRNPDGTTRVRWLLDFTRGPLGLQEDLEREFGCTEPLTECAVYSAEDINELIANQQEGDEPGDSFGHGTHVASLAVGNGRSSPVGEFIGVAPEADLVVVRVTEGGGDLEDADILRGARFVFESARSAGAPAVLNLSLGGDFGPHDGSSALERALVDFIGPNQPGRAIVVAAGNSAGLYASETREAQGPLGVHTTVHVPRSSPVSVPLVILPSSASATLRAGAYVWISFREGDQVALSLELDDKPWITDVGPGEAAAKTHEGLSLVVANGVHDLTDPTSKARIEADERSAVILLAGTWPQTTRFTLRLAGHGTASLWVQGTGDLDPAFGGGALFPFATKEGTINIPATAPELIAVGATLNRVAWTDSEGNRVEQAQNGSENPSRADSIAFFSSAGPNALGMLKPDLVAPGMNVVGAMSSRADPRRGGFSLFANAGRCAGSSECFVVDAGHAVTSGTSMAAPLVAGAVALLFERDPGLTQSEVRARLRAGARPLEGTLFADQQAGLGALDLEATLDAQLLLTTPGQGLPSARSSLVFSASYAHPDRDWPLEGHLELRDESGSIADGFDPGRLAVHVSGGNLLEGPLRIAPGLYRFAVTCGSESGGGVLGVRVTFDGVTLTSKSVPIAVDPGAKTGAVSARGGCSLDARRTSAERQRGFALWCVLALGLWLRHRRAR